MKIILFSLIGIFLLSCDNNQSSATNDITDSVIEELSNSNEAELSTDEQLMQRAKEALLTLKGQNLDEFKTFIHPTKGIRFTPYTTVDTVTDVVLQRIELSTDHSESLINWGVYDGSGEAILLQIKDYFEQFVYNVDFVNAEKHNVNKMIGVGNSLVNYIEIYTDNPFTNHYFSGFDEQFDGLDWASISLFFEKYNDVYYLIGIIHNQWTS